MLDRATEGPKPGLVGDLGATYSTGAVSDVCRDADVIVERTGAAPLVRPGDRFRAVFVVSAVLP